MRVLVTGGAGFIGANLCRSLVERGDVDEVRVIDDLSTGSKDNLDGLAVDLTVGSILDAAALRVVCAGVDNIVHLAARPSVPKSLLDPLASHEANATGTLRVLEAARDVGAHMIVASSSSVYGDTDALPKHEGLPTRPLSPYGVSKLATEAYATAYAASFGLPTLAFRFFNVYGPLQPAGHAYAAVVPAFLDAALHDQPVTIYGDGRQTRDFTYVGSVVNVLGEAIARRVTSPDPVNLAFGSRSSLLDLLGLIEQALGRPVARNHIEPRPGDIRDSQASPQRLAALFPNLQPVLLTTGLRETIQWFETLAATDQDVAT